ncbi:MAG: Gfo/Idh/MocA family oxidoreductase [Sphaerochaetaceae bacterium]|nr:Gfo/Idh/MocA family oxidoreductase [Sphaerochaetaceae bacterium]
MAIKGFGIIGVGMIAEFHAQAIEHMEGCKLVAGFDPVPGKAAQFGVKHNCRGYEKIEDFLNDPDIDICTVATPSGLHLDGAVAAANAKKHVIVEKPLEITPERCAGIIEACKKNNVKLSGVFPSRYHESAKLLKKAVEDGRFGKISFADAQIKWYRSQEYYDSGAWRGTWKMDGGGCFMNQGIHAIDLLQWVMGPVSEVFAFAETLGHERIEVEDTAAAVLRFKNGAVGTIEGTTCAYPGFLKRIEVMGTKGSVIIEEESIIKWEFAEETEADKQIREKFLNNTTSGGGAADPAAISYVPHQHLFEAFVKSLDEGTEPEVSGESASQSVKIICAAYESAKTGKVVKLKE